MLLTFIYFIFVLGVVVCIHEFGHFLFAKRAGIYVYEFSIGMGPQLFKWHRKDDETMYSIRLFPIGGYVKMAGEEVELDEKIPKEKQLQSKSWRDRFLTVIAGILFNFLLAIVIFFLVACIAGAPTTKPVIETVEKGYPSYHTHLQKGDTITKVDGKKIWSLDHFLVELQVKTGKKLNVTVEHANHTKEKITLTPVVKKINGEKVYQYGFSVSNARKRGILNAIQYAFVKTLTLIHQMILIVCYLFTGKIGIDSLSGPVGIFNVLDESAKAGFINVIYLIGFLSANVGFVNLLPIPAFDGGRLLFLIIEKIQGHPVKPEVENMIHAVGFLFLMLLMLVITGNDIMRLFH